MRANILLSNATTLKERPNSVWSYGIPEIAKLARQKGLDLELTPRRLTTAKWLKEQTVGVGIRGLHFSWSWCWWWDCYYNHQASLEDNIKGFLAMLSQASPSRTLEVAREVKPDYLVLHPDAFIRTVPDWYQLSRIPDLCFENNWPEQRQGMAWAIHCADMANAGLVLDTGHMGAVEWDAASPKDTYQRIKDYLGIKRVRVLHLNDYDRATGREHLVPGTGGLTWLPDLLEWLGQDGFWEWGYCVLEVRQPEMEPERLIDLTLTYLDRYNIEPESKRRRLWEPSGSLFV